MVRIKDIAKEAGVSPTTVSNVIHGNTKKVSKANIDKIQRILEKNQYIPSMSALMLAENRSRLIGVLIGERGEAQEYCLRPVHQCYTQLSGTGDLQTKLLYAFSPGKFPGGELETGYYLESGRANHPWAVLRGKPGTE
ncbi:MAG: LacI family DNA-binding transcriptional regulator [Blautia marasmi]